VIFTKVFFYDGQKNTYCFPSDAILVKNHCKKFKHAFVFGIIGHCNPSNLIAFKQTLLNHIADANTMVIKGTYRGQPVKHFFNPTTKLNVMCKNHQDEAL